MSLRLAREKSPRAPSRPASCPQIPSSPPGSASLPRLKPHLIGVQKQQDGQVPKSLPVLPFCLVCKSYLIAVTV